MGIQTAYIKNNSFFACVRLHLDLPRYGLCAYTKAYPKKVFPHHLLTLKSLIKKRRPRMRCPAGREFDHRWTGAHNSFETVPISLLAPSNHGFEIITNLTSNAIRGNTLHAVLFFQFIRQDTSLFSSLCTRKIFLTVFDITTFLSTSPVRHDQKDYQSYTSAFRL
jgi:hypothetical protein